MRDRLITTRISRRTASPPPADSLERYGRTDVLSAVLAAVRLATRPHLITVPFELDRPEFSQGK